MKRYLVNFLRTIICPKEFVVPTEHVVMFDGDGKALNPKGNIGKNFHTGFCNYDKESDDEYLSHLRLIGTEMDNFYSSTANKNKKKKILVFIHGGLNTQVGSLERVVEYFEREKSRCELIKEAGYYPIFINWRSSLFYCYWEHLIWLRQGKKTSGIIALLTFLVVLIVDLGRGLSRSLLVWPNLISNDLKTVPIFRNEYPDVVAKELICRREHKDHSEFNKHIESFKFKKPPKCWRFFKGEQDEQGNRSPSTGINHDTFPIELGEDDRKCREMSINFIIYMITLFPKILIAPVLDAFGTSSWDVMLRHVDLLFNSEDELIESDFTDKSKKKYKLAEIGRNGGLSLLIENLIRKISTDTTNSWEITLVGHSMGTIVANKIIRLFGDKLPIKKIIYLASADTVENYEETIYPYLIRNKDTDIKHLILHPRAEEGETNPPFDFPPRGSLLVWLDNFLTKPLTLMERTAGRYDNLMPALHNAPQKIRNRISICVFSAGKKAETNNPQTHSDVAGRVRYWTI